LSNGDADFPAMTSKHDGEIETDMVSPPPDDENAGYRCEEYVRENRRPTQEASREA